MLYIVAIALCSVNVPHEDCNNVNAVHLERHWIYRPSLELCVDYARQVIATTDIDLEGRYPKVFCIRAETFDQAQWRVLDVR